MTSPPHLFLSCWHTPMLPSLTRYRALYTVQLSPPGPYAPAQTTFAPVRECAGGDPPVVLSLTAPHLTAPIDYLPSTPYLTLTSSIALQYMLAWDLQQPSAYALTGIPAVVALAERTSFTGIQLCGPEPVAGSGRAGHDPQNSAATMEIRRSIVSCHRCSCGLR